jgi:hypothetical protein
MLKKIYFTRLIIHIDNKVSPSSIKNIVRLQKTLGSAQCFLFNIVNDVVTMDNLLEVIILSPLETSLSSDKMEKM